MVEKNNPIQYEIFKDQDQHGLTEYDKLLKEMIEFQLQVLKSNYPPPEKTSSNNIS